MSWCYFCGNFSWLWKHKIYAHVKISPYIANIVHWVNFYKVFRKPTSNNPVRLEMIELDLSQICLSGPCFWTTLPKHFVLADQTFYLQYALWCLQHISQSQLTRPLTACPPHHWGRQFQMGRIGRCTHPHNDPPNLSGKKVSTFVKRYKR